MPVLLLALLFKASTNAEYSNLTFSTTPGLYPKSSPVKYLYLSSFLDDNEEILAASLSKLYSAWFAWILSLRVLSSAVPDFYNGVKYFV